MLAEKNIEWAIGESDLIAMTLKIRINSGTELRKRT